MKNLVIAVLLSVVCLAGCWQTKGDGEVRTGPAAVVDTMPLVLRYNDGTVKTFHTWNYTMPEKNLLIGKCFDIHLAKEPRDIAYMFVEAIPSTECRTTVSAPCVAEAGWIYCGGAMQ